MTRANPKRSGGPKTQAGKLVSAGNSFKTGAYALSTVVLPEEDEKAFHELHEQFVSDFAPRDIAESAMVRDLAIFTWKKMRLERLEKAAIVTELQRPFADSEFSCNGNIDATLANHLVRFRRNAKPYEQLHHKVEELVAQPPDFTLASLERLLRAHRLLSLFLPEIVKDMADPTAAALKARLQDISGGAQSAQKELNRKVILGLREFEHVYAKLIWCQQNPAALDAQLQRVKETRLLRFLEGRSGRRVQDDLDRGFYRTLNELRRHQAWRRSMSELTINPVPKAGALVTE